MLIALLVTATAATAATIYVTPAGGRPGYGADGQMMAAHTEAFSTATLTRVRPGDVVQLLAETADPAAITLYRQRVVLSAPAEQGARSVVIRGLGARTRLVGRSVDELRGCPMPEQDIEQSCGDLRTALLAPRKLDLLAALTASTGGAGAPTDRARLAVPIGRAGRLSEAACLDLDHVDGVSIEDLTFQDCWLAAVRAIGSRRVALRRALILGSSYGLAVRGTKEHPSDDIVVEDVTWIQDASGFDLTQVTREGPFRCRDGRITEFGCAGIMWRTIPWGVSHHGIYEHFNGGLLGSADISGPVVFRRNKVLAAYNGIRLKADGCKDLTGPQLSDASCPFNEDIWIYENLFSYVRDNPVEFEIWAADARIFHNIIHNSHAWFSFDDMGGGPIYVYGNRGWFDDVPAVGGVGPPSQTPPCSRHPIEKPAAKSAFDPELDRRFDFVKARWLPVGVEDVEPSGEVSWMDSLDQSCDAGLQGRVVKLALPPDGAIPGSFRYAERAPIYVFNNSWYLRSPILAIGPAANVRHWNNALQFCEPGRPGYDPELCRVRPEVFDPRECGRGTVGLDSLVRLQGETGRIPFFDCFRWLPLDERGHELTALASSFDDDVSSNGFPPALRKDLGQESNGRVGDPGFVAAERGDFRLMPGALAEHAACKVMDISKGELACVAVPNGSAFAGALDREGRLYKGPGSGYFRPPSPD